MKTPQESHSLRAERHQTILVVDDDEHMRRVTVRILEKTGYDTLEADSGKACFEVLDDELPDLVLLDVVLPDADGFDICRRIKTRPETSHLYVILASGARVEPEEQARGLALGADGYLAKPFVYEEFIARIDSFSRLHRTEQALREDRDAAKHNAQRHADALAVANVQLSESEARYRAIFTHSADSIVVLDPETGVFRDFNTRAHQSLGYDRLTFSGLRLADIAPSAKNEEKALSKARLERLDPLDVVEYETVFVDAEGEPHDVRVRNQKLRIGHELSLLMLWTDVTEEKRAKEEKARIEREMEEQRSLALRADRLRSLGEMAAGIAHELNQPLFGVRGTAENLVIGLDRGWSLSAERLRSSLEEIIEQADRMTYIINHVRTFARESGRPESQPVNLSEIVRSSLNLVRTQIENRGISLEIDLDDDLPWVDANPFALEEVVLNLVNNARDALEEQESTGNQRKSIRLLTTVEGRRDGAVVLLEARDNGIGIDAENIAKIYDPFFTTKPPDRGTGLGLSISKTLVESFDGRLEIQSTPNVGTTATVTFPISAQGKT